MNIRPVKSSDCTQITEIYNFYVEKTYYTFEIEPVSFDEMQQRVEEIVKNYPYLVAEDNLEILAYAYAAPYKSRCAYKSSIEVSVYAKNNAKGKGIGTKLYEKLFEELEQPQIHAIIAGISLPNEASIRLHEKFGFEKVAHFREVGFKFHKWIDVGYWEKINQQNQTAENVE
jgi:phosphinothricin acetyltransferase